MKSIFKYLIFTICLIQIALADAINYDLKQNAGIDPQNFVEIGDHVYFIPQNNISIWMNALQAMAYCKDLGMQLASFETPEENQLVRQYLSHTGQGNTPYWIAGHKFMDTWVWMGLAEEMLYSNWRANEPNDFTTTDVCVQVLGDHGWEDTDCIYSRLFICE